jgi:cytidylate kinase
VESKSLKSIIVGFAGKIGSGKTTISAALAEALNWPRASFGDYVRGVARERGLEESREVLQEIGASLAENPDEFCLSFLGLVDWKPGQNLVVDGIRHAKIIDALRRVTEPSRVFLVFVRVDERVRRKRLLDNRDAGKQAAFGYEAHTTEADVNTVLPALADLVADGARPVPDLVNQIVAWIQDRS